MYVKIYPLNNNVFIIEDQKEEHVTASGLIINAQTGQLIAGRGVIYNISPSTVDFVKKEQGIELKEGQRVYYSLFAAEDVNMEGPDGMPVKGLKKLHISSLSGAIEDE